MRFFQGLVHSFFLFFAVSSCLAAQSFTIDAGVRAGAFASAPPIEAFSNHYFPPSYQIERTLFSIGPSISAVLYNRVEVRFEGARSSFTFRGNSTAGPTSSSSTTRGDLWQFPLLASYAFRSGPARVFAGGGMSLVRRARGTVEGTQTVQYPGQPAQTSSFTGSYGGRYISNPTAYYISGGVERRTSRFSIRPEFRYARWEHFSDWENATLNTRNQFEVLIDFSVHVFRSKQ